MPYGIIQECDNGLINKFGCVSGTCFCTISFDGLNPLLMKTQERKNARTQERLISVVR